MRALDGSEAHLDFLEPVTVKQISNDVAVVARQSGFEGTTDLWALKVYERAGTDFLTDRLQVKDLVGGEEGSPLEPKVVVANTAARRQQIADRTDEPNVISMRAKPDKDGRLLARLDIFNILTVHAQHVIPPDNWLFVGRPGRGFADRGRTLMGWVRKNDVILWPQRQAVYPRVGSSGVIFDDPRLSNRAIQVNIQDDSAAERPFISGKMPLIARSEDRTAFQVAVAVERTETEARTGVTTDDMRQRLWRLLSSIKHREVLFVIDNTESMERYRQPVIDGIQQFIENSKDRESSRYAFAMYGDRLGPQAAASAWGKQVGHWTSPIVLGEMTKRNAYFQFALYDFGRFGEVPSKQALDQFFGGTYRDAQSDAPEMGLSALELAVKAASWQQTQAVRIVVYVGDDQDRDGKVVDAARALADHDVTLIALNVAGVAVDQFNEGWRDNVARLRQAVSDIRADHPTDALVYPAIKTFEHGSGAELAVTRDAIGNYLSAFFVIGSGLGGLDGNIFLSSGNAVQHAISQIKSRLAELNVPSATFLDDFLAARGLQSGDAVAHFYAENDTVRIGYLPQRDVLLYVAMNRLEFLSLQKAMQAVCWGMSDSAVIESAIRDVAVDLAKTFLGEEYTGQRFARGDTEETVSQFFSRLTALPAEYFGVFGDRNVGQFIEYIKSQATTEGFHKVHSEVCLSARLLKAIFDGEYTERTDFQFKGTSRTGEPEFETDKPLKKFDWIWGPRSGAVGGSVQASSFYFVPQDFFPQAVR